MSRRTLIAILVAGAVLRLLAIWQAELWYDENFTLIISRMPFEQMIRASMGDVHPPLYYAMLWLILRINEIPPWPVWTIRLPSALLSIASLLLYPRILRELRVPAGVLLVATAFMALMPMQLHYAQEARMYALLELLMILGVMAVIEWRPLLLIFATAGLLYTQNYGLFYVATLAAVLAMAVLREWWINRTAAADAHRSAAFHGAYMVQLTDDANAHTTRGLRDKWRTMAICMAFGAFLWLPWAPTMLQQASFIQDNYWIFDTSPGGILYEISKLYWALSLATPAANITGILLAFGLLILGVWYLLARRPHAWLIIGTLAFGPIILAIIASLTFQPLLLFRPLIAVTPFLYLASAYPVGTLRTTNARLYAASFIAPILILGVGGYYAFTPQQKTSQGTGSMQAAVAYIGDHWQPGDVILHTSGLGWISMSPYSSLPQYAIPACADKFPGSISPMTADAIGVPRSTIDDLPPHTRIWLTDVESPMLPDCQRQQAQQIIAGREPVLVLSQTKFVRSAVWLLEDR